MAEGSNVLASAATSASYNMMLQLLLRSLTFVLNAVVLRVISKDLLGVVNVRLMLLYTTIRFVANEAFRRACLTSDLHKPWRQVVNFLWCTVPVVSVACCVVFGYLWAYTLDQPDPAVVPHYRTAVLIYSLSTLIILYLSPSVPLVSVTCCAVFGYLWAYTLDQPDPAVVPHYRTAVLIYSLSTLIELLAEPLHILGQMLLFVREKAFIEGVYTSVQLVLSAVLIILFPHLGLIAFCISHLVHTILYFVMYAGYFLYHIRTQKKKDFPFKTVRDILPQKVDNQPLISMSLASLTWSFLKQSFLKQILTEGERYVMTVFDILSFGDQGVYDVVNNLGSLVARFLFKPLEDSGYLFFSQTLERGKGAIDQDKASMDLATQVLQCLLKVVTVIGLVIVTFGFSYSYLALDLYGGSVLSSGSGPTLLRCFCVYVLLLAINGITECFTFSTMSKQEINGYNHKMVVFTAVFLASSWYLTGPLGSAGFIMANCLNMLARIIHSLYYISRFYAGSSYQPLSNVLPAPSVLALLCVCFIITVFSEISLCCTFGWMYNITHIAIGGICGVVLLGTIYLTEKPLIRFVREQYQKRKAEASEEKKKTS